MFIWNGPWLDALPDAVCMLHPVDAGVPAVAAHVINDAQRLKEVKFLTYARSQCWQVAEPGFEPWSLTPRPPPEPPRFLVSSLETKEGWSHGGSDGGILLPVWD